MNLSIDIPPELESRLRAEAAKHGVDPGQYVAIALREHLHSTQSSPSCLSADESQLIEEINRGLTEDDWTRYHELIEKRRAEKLSDDERNELGATAERVESLNVRRMQCLAELARLRDTTMTTLMEQLGIVSPPVI